MKRQVRLGDLQLAIMQVLWERGKATVGEVQEALQAKRPLAYTTVATMLTKMEAKGYVKREVKAKAHLFRPVLRKESVRRWMVTDLAKRLFGGDVTEMVAHLLNGTNIDADELARLKKLIHEKEKETRNGN